MKYIYYMTQRPPMPGAMPKKGLQGIDEHQPTKAISNLPRVYATLIYNRELTQKEIEDYELTAE